MIRRATLILAALVAPGLAHARQAVAPAEPAIPPDQKEMMDAYRAASKPGADHARLAPLIGEWDVVTRAWLDPAGEPMEMKAAVSKAWAFDDKFIKEELTGTDPMGEAYTGVGYLGFDTGAKQYQGVWISSGSTGIISYSGKAAPDGLSFSFTGKESDPTGGPALDFKMTLVINSPDKHTLTFNYIIPGAGEVKAFEMVHTRRK